MTTATATNTLIDNIMGFYKEQAGNLITLAKENKFDVIAHGCNCFCNMGGGLAPKMAKEFLADRFPLEKIESQGDINKLGQIDYAKFFCIEEEPEVVTNVVNAYTQYEGGANADIDAIRLCLRKLNHIFKGKHIGLPLLGCGIGGLDWEDVREVYIDELSSCDVTVVMFEEKYLMKPEDVVIVEDCLIPRFRSVIKLIVGQHAYVEYGYDDEFTIKEEDVEKLGLPEGKYLQVYLRNLSRI